MRVSAERPGTGAWPPRLIIVGEGPGAEEERAGRPFIGRVGEQLNAALSKAGIDRRDCYTTYIMKERRVDAKGKDREPTAEEMGVVAAEFLAEMKPVIETGARVLLVGSAATRFVFDLDTPRYDLVGGLDTLNGRAFMLPLTHPWALDSNTALVMPCYHPAAGLRDVRHMTDFFWAVREVGRPNVPITRIHTKSENQSELLKLYLGLRASTPPAVDTESAGKYPWCATIARSDYWQFAGLPNADPKVINALDSPAVYHNGLYDHGVLTLAGYKPVVKDDTMVMAYHLGTEPLGLKQLVFRYFGLLSPTWEQVVGPADAASLDKWIEQVLRHTSWPPPEGRKKLVHSRFESLRKKLYREGPKAVRKMLEDHDLMPTVEPVVPCPPPASLAGIPFDDAREYAMADPVYTGALHQELDPQIDSMKLRAAYETDILITPLVAHMQRVGMPVNLQRVHDLKPRLEQEMAQIRLNAIVLTGEDSLNLSSGDQVAAALLQTGAPLEKRTPGGKLSTGKQVLKAIAAGSPLAQLALDYRERHKLLNTFVPALLEHAKPQWETEQAVVTDPLSGVETRLPPPAMQLAYRIHPQIRMTNTETGRLACHSPNLLAFPARTKLGTAIRECFEAPTGWLWVGADLDQIEMRLLAEVTGDEAMREAVRSEDMHALTASKMFRQPLENVRKGAPGEKRYRTPAKTTGFLVAYRGGPTKLGEGMAAEGIVEPVEYWAEIIESWYRVYPGVRQWQRERDIEADVYGYVRDMWGRMRHVEGVWSTDHMVRSACQREASNFPIQSGAQGLLKRAMIRVWNTMQQPAWKGAVECLLQIHDELVFLVKEDRAQEWAEVLQRIMVADQRLFSVPISSTSQVAKTWGGLK